MIDAFSCRCASATSHFPIRQYVQLILGYVNLQLPPYGSSVALKSLPERMSHRAELDTILGEKRLVKVQFLITLPAIIAFESAYVDV